MRFSSTRLTAIVLTILVAFAAFATFASVAAATPGAYTVRFAGADRYETAMALARSHFPTYIEGDTVVDPRRAQAVVLARGDAFPDAVAAAPLAAAMQAPVLLTPPDRVHALISQELRFIIPRGSTVYLLGGTAALGPQVEQGIRELGFNPVRIGGADRFETAARIAQQVPNPTSVFVADGMTFPAPLIAGNAAGKERGVMLLTNGPSMPPATAETLSRLNAPRRYAVGTAAHDAAREAAGFEYIGTSDPHVTAVGLAERFFTNARRTFVATSDNFADALAAGAVASVHEAPLLLTSPNELHPHTAGYLHQQSPHLNYAVIVGGTSAISQQVEDQAAASMRQTQTLQKNSPITDVEIRDCNFESNSDEATVVGYMDLRLQLADGRTVDRRVSVTAGSREITGVWHTRRFLISSSTTRSLETIDHLAGIGPFPYGAVPVLTVSGGNGSFTVFCT